MPTTPFEKKLSSPKPMGSTPAGKSSAQAARHASPGRGKGRREFTPPSVAKHLIYQQDGPNKLIDTPPVRSRVKGPAASSKTQLKANSATAADSVITMPHMSSNPPQPLQAPGPFTAAPSTSSTAAASSVPRLAPRGTMACMRNGGEPASCQSDGSTSGPARFPGRHAQDSMVLPTLQAKGMQAMACAGRDMSAGLVHVGRDKPIGLDVSTFLGPSNPFGEGGRLMQQRQKQELSDEQVIASLTEPASAMKDVMRARLSHLKVVSALWGTAGAQRAVEHALDMNDMPTLVDVLSAAQARLVPSLNLEMAIDIAPSLKGLVDSDYEDYVLCGLGCLSMLLKSLGPLLRETKLIKEARGAARGAVDLHFEERQEQCETLTERLQQIQPRLKELSQRGKGRSTQLATRAERALLRAVGDDPTG